MDEIFKRAGALFALLNDFKYFYQRQIILFTINQFFAHNGFKYYHVTEYNGFEYYYVTAYNDFKYYYVTAYKGFKYYYETAGTMVSNITI